MTPGAIHLTPEEEEAIGRFFARLINLLVRYLPWPWSLLVALGSLAAILGAFAVVERKALRKKWRRYLKRRQRAALRKEEERAQLGESARAERG